MPLDVVIIDKDQAVFLPTFGAAIVAARPGVMKGTGKTRVKGKFVCVDGDEKKLSVPWCPYISGAHTIPGIGTVKIDSLASNQKTIKTRSGGKPMILRGLLFTAVFEVMIPAINPSSAPVLVPDTTTKYKGHGLFVSSNIKFKAT